MEEGASPCTGICSVIPKTLSGHAQDLLAAMVHEQGLEMAKDTGVGALLLAFASTFQPGELAAPSP